MLMRIESESVYLWLVFTMQVSRYIVWNSKYFFYHENEDYSSRI